MQQSLMIMQLILSFSNLCIIGYAFFRFLKKPHDNLEERLHEVELSIKEIKSSLFQGNDRFRNQESTNEVLIHSTLALIEFEIQYCLTEKKQLSKDLERAKEDLHSYLARK